MNSYHLPTSYSMPGSQTYPQSQYNNNSTVPVQQHLSRQAMVPAPPSYSHCSSSSALLSSNQAPQNMYGQRYMPLAQPAQNSMQNNMTSYRRPMNHQNGDYFYGSGNQSNYPKAIQQTENTSRYYQPQGGTPSMPNILQTTNEYPHNAFVHQNSSHFDNSFFSTQYGGPPQGCDASRSHQMRNSDRQQQTLNSFAHNPHQQQFSMSENNVMNQSIPINQKSLLYDQMSNPRLMQHDPNKASSWTHQQNFPPYDSSNFNRQSVLNSHSNAPDPNWGNKMMQNHPLIPEQSMRQPFRFSEQEFAARQTTAQPSRNHPVENYPTDQQLYRYPHASGSAGHQVLNNNNNNNNNYSATLVTPTPAPAPYDPPSYHNNHCTQTLPDESPNNMNLLQNKSNTNASPNFNVYTNTELAQILNDPDDMNSILSAPYVPSSVEQSNNCRLQSNNISTNANCEPTISRHESLRSLPVEAKEKLRQLTTQRHSIPKSELVPKVKEIIVQYIGNKNFSRSLALYSDRERSKSAHQIPIQPYLYKHPKSSGVNSGIKELLDDSLSLLSRSNEETMTPPPPPPSYPKIASKVGVFSSVVQSPEEGPGSSPIDESVQSTTNPEEDNLRLFENSISPMKLPMKLPDNRNNMFTRSSSQSSDVLESLLSVAEPDQDAFKVSKDLFISFPSPSNPCDSAQQKEESKQSPGQNKNCLLINLLYGNEDLKKNLKRKHDSGSTCSISSGPPDPGMKTQFPPHNQHSSSHSDHLDGFKRCSSMDSLINLSSCDPSPDPSTRPLDSKRPRNQSHQPIGSPLLEHGSSANPPSRMQNYPAYRYSTSSTPSPVGHILAQLLSDNSEDSPGGNTKAPQNTGSTSAGSQAVRKKSLSSDKTVNTVNNVKLSSEAFKCPNEHLNGSQKAPAGIANHHLLLENSHQHQTTHSQPKEPITTPDMFPSMDFFNDYDFDLIDMDFDEILNSNSTDGKDVLEELEKSDSKIVISSADSRGDIFMDFKELLSNETMSHDSDNTAYINETSAISQVCDPARLKTQSSYGSQVSSSMKNF